MPKIFSVDYKFLTVQLFFIHKLTIKNILKMCNICRKTFYNWRKLYKNNNLDVIKKYNKTSKFTSNLLKYIKNKIIRKKILNIHKLIKIIKKKFNIIVSRSSIYNILKLLNITYKRAYIKNLPDKKKNKKKVKKLLTKVKKINKNKIISLDETSIEINMKPLYGWNFSGKKVIFINKKPKKIKLTVIAAYTINKLIGLKIVHGSVNACIFKNFLEDTIEDKKYYLLLDNARIHHAKIIKKYMKNKTNKLLFNVAYNPETNPIEQCFSKVKNIIRKNKNDNIKNLTKTINKAFNSITKNDLKNYFKNSLKI